MYKYAGKIARTDKKMLYISAGNQPRESALIELYLMIREE